MERLETGEVGYIITGVKEVAQVRVGDTITALKRPAEQALPGYKVVHPMVFCGLFPTEGDKFGELRDALEKLTLNDAALSWEPETSQALGFGFRCGFLGLLHMDIVRERLEREYDLELITTTPNVEYHVFLTDGAVVPVRNPAQMPEAGRIDHVEEPYVAASVILPTEFVGTVMELCQGRRSDFVDMKYLSPERVEMHYQLPLGEIVIDFFDQLKSRTRGYASLDYEFWGYRLGDLVKLDVLLARRAGRRTLADRAPRAGAAARPGSGREAAPEDPAAALRGRHPGRHRQPGRGPRDRQGAPQRRDRQVLRRRHQPQAQTPRKAERGQEAHEADRRRRGAARRLPGRARARLRGQGQRMSAAAGAGRGRRDAAPAPRHLYIHVPFCAERCDYCEFHSVAVGRAGRTGGAAPAVAAAAGPTPDRERLFDRFVAALSAEWERERERFGVRGLETVFLGGGTPSLLGRERLERLLEPLEALLTPRAEITVETNPEDVTADYAAWAAARRLRVSLGVQSFDAGLRAALGRRGAADPAEAFAALRAAGVGAPADGAVAPARRPGAAGLGIDLIFGLPGQQVSDVEAELAIVERLRPDQVSFYELSLAPASVLAARVALTTPGAWAGARPSYPTTRRWP